MLQRKPDWLRIRVHSGKNNSDVEMLLKNLSLNTVCDEANCPNRMECFNRRTATFMILGRNCTRNCTFCNVTKAKPQPVDPEEPRHVAQAVKELHLKHVVVTSVTRDDLEDGGAGHFAEVIKEVRALNGEVAIEVLIPDFRGDKDALEKVVQAKPHIINHNVETIPRLYPTVRPMAVYERSLELLKRVKEMDNTLFTKSGIMVGLGETEDEVLKLMKDLRDVDCDFMTIGQYLAPSRQHHEVVEYVHPDIFEKYKEEGIKLGFLHIESAPLVRSSYQADRAFNDRE